MSTTFTCEVCQSTYEKIRSEKEVEAEFQSIFDPLGEASMPRAVVCDDCFQAMRPMWEGR